MLPLVSRTAVVSIALVCVACEPQNHGSDEIVIDVAPTIPERRPVAADAGPCVAAPETCDGRDEDCDGSIDEDGAGCTLANSTATCAGGRCLIAACAPGYADCNGLSSDGCESDLGSPGSCGACGRDCYVPHATVSCTAGTCSLDGCDAGWADCDADASNGCEQDLSTPSHCGACGSACAAPNAIAGCSSGACHVMSCVEGWADCNGSFSDGCEVRLDGASSCGACGAACTDPGTACVGTTCSLISCPATFADCDGDLATGCETSLWSDAAHCGSCGTSCAGGRECAAGRCVDSVIQVDGGAGHTCLRRSSGEVACWGLGDHGQIGDGGGATRYVPSRVSSLPAARHIGLGRIHSCAVATTGSVHCWGYNGSGELGHGGTELEVHVPVAVTDITDAVEVGGGFDFTCALRADGRVSCWGGNAYGQLGNGTTTPSPAPVAVSGVTDAAALAVGDYHVCVLRRTGDVACWGRNDQGQVGTGSVSSMVSTATPVVGLSAVRVLAAGGRHNCTAASGGVYCWGANQEGQLGDGSTAASASPTVVVGLADALALCAGSQSALHHRNGHTCAIATDDRVLCWGGNSFGQRGDGTTAPSSTPVQVHGLEAANLLGCGNMHTCAGRPLGSLECWGAGDRGQLGNGSTIARYAPVVVGQVP